MRKITKGIHSCKPASLNCPIGDFGQDVKLQNKGTLLIGLGLGCKFVETVIIAHRLGDFVVNPL